MSIWCPLGRKLSTPYAVLCQPIRTRYVADPGTLEQRLFRAVTQPVIPPLGITPTERRIRNQEQRRIREENNPYRKFLVERARSDFFREADDRMVLVIQPLHHKWREFVPIRNQLFLKNMVFHGFPVPILREAAIGTRWENFTEHFLQTSSHNFYLFGDADPLVCRNALSILKTASFLLLLGGVVQHRIMTANQLQEYAGLASSGGLDGARGRLLGLLGCKSQELLSTMTRHQTDIVFGLHQLGCSAAREN